MYFPYDFGFIESTHAVMAIRLMQWFYRVYYLSGVRLTCRIIGALQVKQIKKGVSVRNDRYFAVPEDFVVFEHIKDIKDFSAHIISNCVIFL
jgi:inorganic pyrophosphatase